MQSDQTHWEHPLKCTSGIWAIFRWWPPLQEVGSIQITVGGTPFVKSKKWVFDNSWYCTMVLLSSKASMPYLVKVSMLESSPYSYLSKKKKKSSPYSFGLWFKKSILNSLLSLQIGHSIGPDPSKAC